VENPEFYERLKLLIGDDKPFAWAARVGLSKGAFNRVWNQGTIPSHEGLVKIKIATGVSLDWLLTGEGGNEPVKHFEATYHAEDYLLGIMPRLHQIIELHYSYRGKAICHLVRFKNGELQLVYSRMNYDRGARIEEVEKVRHGMALYSHQLLYSVVSEEQLLSIEKNPNQKVMEDILGQAKHIMPHLDAIKTYNRWMNMDEIFAAQYEAPERQSSDGPIEEFLFEKRKAGHDTGWVSLAFAECFPEFKEWLKKRRETTK
jgi:transcriptional regulator with XRE-family HTH domain